MKFKVTQYQVHNMNDQLELLSLIKRKYSISPKVESAFLRCPRHLFIERGLSMDDIYSDYPLEIYRDKNFISTISQPSFVLLMIEMLNLSADDTVLEVGTGSGWNAALMSCLCRSVVTVEIIPQLAHESRERLQRLGFNNVEVIQGDGAFGHLDKAPYDKGVFTAGATDLPKAFHEQIKDGGLLLFVLKTTGADLLLLLMKKGDHFEEIQRIPCSFVPLKGKKEKPQELDSLFTVGPAGRIHIYPNQQEGPASIISVT
jgi:protein-L-isoaspartate(D-aspartate) O-methyltransferase